MKKRNRRATPPRQRKARPLLVAAIAAASLSAASCGVGASSGYLKVARRAMETQVHAQLEARGIATRA